MRYSKTMAAMIAVAVLLPGGLARAEALQISPQRTPGLRDASRWDVAQAVPDRLVVARTKNNRNNPNAPPFSKTIDDRSSVAKLYADIAALPVFPSGPRNCPNDSGIAYHLDFYAQTTVSLAADYDPSGCASVTLSDGTIKNAAAGDFRADLRQALGFTSDRQLLGLP
jgi:hypothetical protein